MVLRDGFQDTFVDVGGHIYSRVGEYGDFYGDISRYYLCHLGLATWVSGGHGPGHHIRGAYWPPEYRTRVATVANWIAYQWTVAEPRLF